MMFSDKDAIQILGEVIDAVETLSLSDPYAWYKLCEKIARLTRAVPSERKNLKESLDVCAAGIHEISQSKIVNPLALSDALYMVLETIIAHLSDPTSDPVMMEKPGEQLKELIKEARHSAMSTPLKPSTPSGISESALNDVSMMLIQLDQEDREGLQNIKDGLVHLRSLDIIQEYVVSQIQEALSLVDLILDQPGCDWDEQIGRINHILDAAVTVVNQKTASDAGYSGHDGTDAQEGTSSSYNRNTVPDDLLSDMVDENLVEQEAFAQICGDDAMVPELEKMEKDSENMEAVNATKKEKPSDAEADETAGAVDDKDYMPEDADLEMLGEFISESNDLIAAAEEALLSLEVDPGNRDAIGTVFRAFHTVKGTSAFLELNLLSEMAHYAENLLSRVRENEIRYSGGYADLSLKALDMIKDLVGLVEKAISGVPLRKPPGYDALLTTLANPEAEGISEDFDEDASPRVGDILVATGKVSRADIEETVSKYAGRPVGEALVQSKVSKVQDVGQALRTQTKLKGTVKHAVESTVRVSTHRLDKLVDMVGEMVIAHSMIAQDEIVSDSQNHALLKKVTQTGKIVRELQDLSMSMRMIPLKATFQKMARLIRDVGRKVGKNVNLVTEGEDTEIDRNLVDYINDPLVHMVRNSVDHGIESPEEREKQGKPPIGTVKLAAYHSAGNVVVEISDDGKGLDRDLILKKALEKNLIEKGKTLTDKEIYNLIFEPGFSTAQTVTDVSGRGVGMDVVRKNIETLRGTVEISSEKGKGSVFKIYLPLTLAIIDGMVIRVANESYVLPTESIVRSIKPDPKDISTVFNEGRVLSLQGKLIPIFRLSNLYDIKLKGNDNEQSLVVIIEDDTTRAGIIIDELVGRQQVVVKSLGESMKGIPGISGGAIMPNGRVGLIIDVGGIIKMIHSGYEKRKEVEKSDEMKMAG